MFSDSAAVSSRSWPLRVIQWATGAVGRHALAAITAHPDLELVGARVYSEDKAGRDVGELCGLGPTGVIATSSTDEVLALPADCVLYAARGEANPMLEANAMHAIHAIPHVCAAPPGIRTFLELPMITDRGAFAFGGP